MDRFFMQRASAVAYLMDRRRRWLQKIETTPGGDVEFERQEIELLAQLILDVRAARVNTFQFTRPQAVEIYVSDN
ncbi:hypothetical protein P3T24_005817 [Paraburkholderia sp. GAS33]|jgi:hypothetical protein|uniref:hypothetical protein n=1 Tax=Paraburkholderia sp. GAS33 TaxID=3035130 RepID=UPI003D1CB981